MIGLLNCKKNILCAPIALFMKRARDTSRKTIGWNIVGLLATNTEIVLAKFTTKEEAMEAFSKIYGNSPHIKGTYISKYEDDEE